MKMKTNLTNQNIEAQTAKAVLLKLKCDGFKKVWLPKKFVYQNGHKLSLYLPENFTYKVISGRAGTQTDEMSLEALKPFLAIVDED